MSFIDVHIHLADEEYTNRIHHILQSAEAVGVVALVANSQDLETSRMTIKLAEEYPHLVYAALGMHPWQITEQGVGDAKAVAMLIRNHASTLAAVGEIGLDKAYVRVSGQMEAQRSVFREMLSTAEDKGLPVIVHSRQSIQEVLEEVAAYRLKSVVLHWYSGPIELLEAVVKRGYWITVGPALYYAENIQKIAAQTPLTNILTETDGPVRYRGIFAGKETAPSFIPAVVKKLSELKRVSEEDVTKQILKNSLTAFPRLAEILS